MKKINTFPKLVLASTMITSIILPSLTFAAVDGQKNNVNFCEQLATKRTETLTKIADHVSKQDSKQSERELKMANRFSTNDSTKLAKQESNEANFTAKIAELKTKYPEAEKQTAITNFENAVNQARTLKQSKLETAVNSFRTQIESLIGSKAGNGDVILADFQSKVTAAFDKAQTSCANGVESNTIKNTFKAEMESAKTGIKDSKSGLTSIKTQVEQLASAKKESITSIQQEFKNSVEAASQTLKLALK